jgi:hypothetical protein
MVCLIKNLFMVGGEKRVVDGEENFRRKGRWSAESY